MKAFELWPEAKSFKIIAGFGVLIAAASFLIVREHQISSWIITGALFLIAVYYFVEGRLPNPENALYLLTAYLPFSKQLSSDVGDFPSPFAAVIVLSGIIFGHLAMNPETRRRLREKTALHLPMGIFLSLGVLSVLHAIFLKKAPAGFVVYEFLRIWIAPLAIFLSVYHSLRSHIVARNVVWIMMIALCFISLATIYQFLTAGDVKPDESRVGGIANDPNILATYLDYMMFIALGFFLMFFQKKPGWIFGGVFLGALRALLGTFSRGGYLAFLTGLFSISFFRKKVLVIPLLLVLAGVLFHPQLLPKSIRGRIAATIEHRAWEKNSKGHLDRSNSDRIEIWKGAIAMIKDHPVSGVGFTRFVPTVADYWKEGIPFDAHNTFFFIAAEMGVPACAVFVSMLGIFFWKTYRLNRKTPHPFEKALSLGMLGAMAALLPSHFYVIRLDSLEIAGYFWILMAMILRYSKDLPATTAEFSMTASALKGRAAKVLS